MVLRSSDADIISQLVVKRTQMTISELISFFDFKELLRFFQLNKTCKAILTPGDPKCLRFDVLFDKRKNECKLHWPTWKEDIATILTETRSFGKMMKYVQNLLA